MNGLLFIPLLLTGLLDRPRFLVPVWFDAGIDNTKVSSAEFNGVTVSVENLVSDDGKMIFDVYFRNDRDEALAIDPSKIYLLSSNTPFPDVNDTGNPEFESRLTRYSPMTEQEVEAGLRQEIRNYRNRNTLLGLIGVGLVIVDAAADISDFHHEWSPGRQHAAIFRDWLTFGGLTTLDALSDVNTRSGFRKNDDLHFLHREILKEGRMAARHDGRGKVFYEGIPGKYIRIIVPAGDTDFSFDFRPATAEDYRKLRGTSGY